MPDKRNKKKRIGFRAKMQFLRIVIWGSKCAYKFSRKRVPSGFYLGTFGVIFPNFSIPPKGFSQKFCFGCKIWSKNCKKFVLGVKFRAKIARKFSFRWCFSWKGQILIKVCLEKLRSSICTTLVFKISALPPTL